MQALERGEVVRLLGDPPAVAGDATRRRNARRGWQRPEVWLPVVTVMACLLSLRLVAHRGHQREHLRPKDRTTADKGVSSFFWITDFHLEPFYCPSTRPSKCGTCRPDEGDLQGCPSTDRFNFGRIGCDPPSALLRSELAQIRELDANPEFFVFTGDAVAHCLPTWEHITKTATQAAATVREFFPNTPMFVTIGNIDLFPANRLETGSDPQMRDLFDAYDAAGVFDTTPDARETFVKGGYYSARPVPGLRVVSFNTMLYVVKRLTLLPSKQVELLPCDYDVRGEDPTSQWAWMRAELTAARELGEKVLLMSHVAPGAKEHKENWCPNYLAVFEGIVEEFVDVIVGQFYGDHNRNELRLLYGSDGQPTSVAYIIPGTTPRRPTLEGANPMFRRVFYTKTAPRLVEFQDYVFPLERMNFEAALNTAEESEPWRPLVPFTDDFGLRDLSPASLAELVEKMYTNFTLTERYVRRQLAYAVGDRDGIEYACDARYVNGDEVRECWSGTLAT